MIENNDKGITLLGRDALIVMKKYFFFARNMVVLS